MKKMNHIRWGVSLTYIQLFLSVAISIAYTPVMLQILGPSQHGLYSTVSSTISWLSLLSLGFNASYIRFYSKYKSRNDSYGIAGLNGVFLLLFSAMGAVAILCGIFLANNLELLFGAGMTQEEYTTARVLSLIVTLDLAISFPASVFNAMIRAQEKFIQVKLVNMLQVVFSPLVTLPILFMGYGSIGMVTVTTAVDFLAYALNAFYCFRKLHVKVRFRNFEKGIFKEISGFSFFIAINSIVNQINSNLDKMLITRYINTAAASVYAIGFSLYSYYGSFSNAVSSMFVPRVHKIVNDHSNAPQLMRQGLTEIFVRLGRIQYYIQMLVMTGLIFFGRAFIYFWAGPEYADSYYVAIILCAVYTIPLCQSIGIEIQRAQNKHQVRSVVYLIMALFNVGLTIVLCQRYGIVGATIGTAISALAVELVFLNIYYHKKLNIDVLVYWRNILRVSVGLIVPVLLGIAINHFVVLDSVWKMLCWIGIYTVVYLVSIWLFAMNPYEKDIVIGKMLRRIRGK